LFSSITHGIPNGLSILQSQFSRYITQRIKRKPKDAPKEEEADAPDDKKPEPSKDSKKDRMDPMRHRVEEEFISEEEEEEESRSEQEIIDDLLDEEEEDDFPWEGMWDEDEDIEEVEEEEYYPSLPLGRGHR
jgi:hypothetical protein